MITEKLLEADRCFGLFQPNTTVTVACSGGADSMALLHLLWSMRDQLGITVRAAHYNHGIRGAEADHDADFVKYYCMEHTIPYFYEKGNVPEYATKNHLGLETAARELRYDFLTRVADDGVIATAHTASDHLETVLLHLIRGCGTTGLAGIPPKRDSVIRPLILCTRAEIESYCEAEKIPFVRDSSNDDDFCDRNRIRHHIVPLLKKMNPAVENAVLRASFISREDNAALETFADDYAAGIERVGNGYLLKDFSGLPRVVGLRVLRRIYSLEIGETADYFHLNQLYDCCVRGGKISLPKDITAEMKDSCLKFLPKVPISKAFFVQYEKIIAAEENVHNLLFKNALDCDTIIGDLVCRTRLPGDRVRLLGTGGTKTLKKLYNEYHIPVDERENLPVVTDDNGIVWIAKLGVAERCAVTEQTKQYIKITFTEGEKNNGC